MALMEAVDSCEPERVRSIARSCWRWRTCSRSRVGTVALTGRVEAREVRHRGRGQWACALRKTVVTGVEMFNKSMDSAQAEGQHQGALARGEAETSSEDRC